MSPPIGLVGASHRAGSGRWPEQKDRPRVPPGTEDSGSPRQRVRGHGQGRPETLVRKARLGGRATPAIAHEIP